METDRPTPERYASRIYEDMGAVDLAADAAVRAAERAPADASAWERIGRLRLRQMDRAAAIAALERARLIAPTLEGLLDLALAYHLAGDVGAEVSAAEAATGLDESSPAGLVDVRPRAGPHRPARRSASPPASARWRSGPDPEVSDLLGLGARAAPARDLHPHRRLTGIDDGGAQPPRGLGRR